MFRRTEIIMDHEYSMKWNNHNKDLTEWISKYLENNKSVDVTIVCYENFSRSHSIKAHKVVLAAYSSFFENLFMQNSSSLSTVFLNISSQQMELLLKYMYTGEVSIKLENSQQLLYTAKSLMIRGFCDDMELYLGKYNQPLSGILENHSSIYNTTIKNESVRIIYI